MWHTPDLPPYVNMNYEQDLQAAYNFCNKQFEKNPNRRLTSLFRDLRKRGELSNFGDYLLMSVVVDCSPNAEKDSLIFRKTINNMCLNSKEYKELGKRAKMSWIDNLVKMTRGDL
jgi:hypothetical protein